MEDEDDPYIKYAKCVVRFHGELNDSVSTETLLVRLKHAQIDSLHLMDIKADLKAAMLSAYVDDVVLVARHVANGPDSAAQLMPDVPAMGERLISYLCSAKIFDDSLGDLQEGFNTRCAKFGARHGRRWYWFQVLRTGLTFACDCVRRIVAAEEWVGRLGS